MNVKYIITIVVSVLVTAIVTFLLASGNKTENSNNRNIADVVYDANYSSKINLGSYNAVENFSVDDIVLPYINIDSDDANKVNEEIKTMFNGLLETYKTNLADKKIWVKTNYLNYETQPFNNNERFASIVIQKTFGGTTIPRNEEVVYVFNLTTKKSLSMKEIIDVFKTTLAADVDIKLAIKTMIMDYINKALESNTNLTVEEKNNLINTTIATYEQLYDTNKLLVYLDNAGQLNISVNIYLENKIQLVTLMYK